MQKESDKIRRAIVHVQEDNYRGESYLTICRALRQALAAAEKKEEGLDGRSE